MKLSFPLSSKPSSTDTPKLPNSFTLNEDDDEEEQPSQTNPSSNKEFITEFTPSEPSTHRPTFTIPPLQNTWKPLQENPNLGFEESLSSTTSYGLNLRTKKVVSDDGGDNLNKGSLLDLKLLRKLREDIKNLPEDRGLEEFADFPVEEFGKAVLSGYGWHEGRGIGKNAKEDVKVVQYEGRVGRHGLGFVPKAD